jgi:hypothetical protein
MQRAPTTSELLNEIQIQQALEQAWLDSQPADPANRHEEGGWIYMDTSTGAIRRAPAGARASLDLTTPVLVPGSVVVATFHRHPNPAAEDWELGPSPGDEQSA